MESLEPQPAPSFNASGLLGAALGLGVLGLAAWLYRDGGAPVAPRPAAAAAAKPAEEDHAFVLARQRMIADQLRIRDIADPGVLDALGRVPRQRFVPETFLGQAYDDQPLPIGYGQTITQPYLVALMTQAARPAKTCRALEIGAGSGYQAAVLAELCREVYTVEIIPPLADAARQRLATLGYRNVTVRDGDGYGGWPEQAPFDIILVTAAATHVPPALSAQLAVGGRMVIPIGQLHQELLLLTKRPSGDLDRQLLTGVSLPPMSGEAEAHRQP